MIVDSVVAQSVSLPSFTAKTSSAEMKASAGGSSANSSANVS